MKATVTQLTTLYYKSMQNIISECSSVAEDPQVPLLSAYNKAVWCQANGTIRQSYTK